MKPRFIKLFLALFLPFASFLLLAHFLFYYNNKYENNPVYPMGGVMFCSDADLSGDSVIFLAHQWNFFPGKQYTPSDFNEKSVTGGTFLTLGSFGNFSLGSTSEASNGTATYRLTLSLPDTARTYSLYLPEIFSAYTLYLNEEKVCSQGNPDPAHYQDLIGNKEISFTASGTVHITIIVTNYSHIYSGITYPPAFGTVTAIQKYLSTRLFISGITLAAIFLFAACSLFFFCRLKHNNALVFTILCSLFFVVSLYPVLFSYGSFTVFPWYPLEIACLTAMYPCMVLLQGTILNLPKKLIRRETLIFGSCVVLSLVFTLFLHGSTHFAKIYSEFLFLYKAGCALLLLFQAYYSYQKESLTSPILLIGIVLFASSLTADRMYPGYEPIYGGWFQEIGTFLLVVSIGYELWQDLSKTYRAKLLLEEETHYLAKQIEIQKAHYQELTERIDESIRLRHDHRHHMQTVTTYLQNNEREKALEYLAQYAEQREQKGRIVLCRNMLADAILQYYQTLCKNNDVAFECLANLPQTLSIPDTDFSILFGNLLENAWEAARQTPENAYIRIQIQPQKNNIVAMIENSCKKEPIQKANRFFSTKHSGMGIGTQSARLIVDKAKGVISFEPKDEIFVVRFVLPNTVK